MQHAETIAAPVLKTGEINTQYVGKSRVTTGRFTYGISRLRVREWGEGASLDIGSFCSIARDVLILLGGEHDLNAISTYPFGANYPEFFGSEHTPRAKTKGNVEIGSDVWIGTGVTITSGVTIGHGAVIAAQSNVVKDVEPYQIVGGNPARPIRYRFEPEMIERLLRLRWWDLSLNDIRAIVPMLGQAPSIDVLDDLLLAYRVG